MIKYNCILYINVSKKMAISSNLKCWFISLSISLYTQLFRIFVRLFACNNCSRSNVGLYRYQINVLECSLSLHKNAHVRIVQCQVLFIYQVLVVLLFSCYKKKKYNEIIANKITITAFHIACQNKESSPNVNKCNYRYMYIIRLYRQLYKQKRILWTSFLLILFLF